LRRIHDTEFIGVASRGAIKHNIGKIATGGTLRRLFLSVHDGLRGSVRDAGRL
jgi:hypothetical protein